MMHQGPVSRRMVGAAVGITATLAFWELVGQSHTFGAVWPPLTAVFVSNEPPDGLCGL